MKHSQPELKGHGNTETVYVVGMTGPSLITLEDEETLKINCKLVNIQFKNSKFKIWAIIQNSKNGQRT